MPSQENLSQKMESIDQVEDHLEKNFIESIGYTKQLIDSDMIDQVVHLMKESCVIDIYGRGASYLVGLDFRYKLCRLGYQVQMNESIDLQTIQAVHSSSDHCALIISSSGETPELLNFAQILNRKGTPLITLTSTKDCSLLKYSDSLNALKQIKEWEALRQEELCNMFVMLFILHFLIQIIRKIPKLLLIVMFHLI